MNVGVIRTNGAREAHKVPPGFDGLRAIRKLIGAETLDTVNLRDGRVMLVDDRGWATETVELGPGHISLEPIRALKPINPEATKLYHGVCVPGTTHQIVGDVAIVVDAEM